MKRTSKRSRIPSPARSLVVLQSKRYDPNRSLSVDPDPRLTPSDPNSTTRSSNAHTRISGSDFVATSFLQDHTAVNSARKEGSWWKALDDNSTFANEVLQAIDSNLEGVPLHKTNDDETSTRGINVERRSNSLQMPSQISSDSLSPRSINVQRKTFYGGKNKAKKIMPHALKNLASTGNIDKERPVSQNSQQRKTFFGGGKKGMKSPPIAPEEHTVATNTRLTPSDPNSTTRSSNAHTRISGSDFVATSCLQDHTAVNSARKEGSWWKALDDNSTFANEVLQAIDNNLEGVPLHKTNDDETSTRGINVERRSNSLQMPSQISSDSLSPRSINVQRKTFYGGKNKAKKIMPHALKNLASTGNIDKERPVSQHSQQRKTFFGGGKKGMKSPPIDNNNNNNNKTSKQKAKTKKLFFQKTKDVQPRRGYEKFILESSGTDDSLDQIETVANTNAQALQNGQPFQIGSFRLSNASEIIEFENWKLLPSSTMIESAEQSEINPDTPRKTMQTPKTVSIANSNLIATDNESNEAIALRTQRSTRFSHHPRRLSSPMTEKENLNLENPLPMTESHKLSNVLDASSDNIRNRNRSKTVTENYSLNITNNKSGSKLQQVNTSHGRSQRSRKSKSISKDLQSHNEHNTRSRNSSLDSPRPLQTSKRSSKLLGPKSKREKRMTSMRESSQHNMEANSEGQKIIPETLETETQRLSSSPFRKSRSNKTREGIQSVTQYVHQSGQSNSISKELTPKRLKSVSMAVDTKEDDEQINQTDNEEVTSNDDEKLNFSFNHGSGKSNVTRRKSTSTSTRSDRNVSKTIEQNIIDENGQQDQQNVTNKGSIVSTNNVSNISAKLTNKENTSKASQRKSSSNHLSTGNKSVNQNSNRVEIQKPEIQQDKKIDSARRIISSRRNICRVSVEIASNHSKRTEISSNESTGTKYLNDNSNRSLVNADTHQNSNRSENEDFQTQRSRKSKSISKDLQSHNEHNTRSRNSSLDSPRPLQTSKRSSKLLGPKSKREKRMTSMRESSQHNMEANSEGQKIIPETLETETQRLSSSPLRKSRSNKTREGIQSVTQYVHQSGQSNSISKELTPKRLKSVSMAVDTKEDDEQINQTDYEEVTSNDDEKLNFSFNHRSGKSNVTRRKSTSTSTRSDRNVSKTIEQNIIDENGQQDQQNVTNKGSIVSTNNVSNISAKLTNKENTSKASQRKSSSNHLSTGNKSVNQNSNRVEIQEPEIQQDKKIDSARQIISSRRNICRVSVEIASNHSKRTEISSNESTGTKYLNDNSNRSLVNADTHQNSNRSENEDFQTQRSRKSKSISKDLQSHNEHNTRSRNSSLDSPRPLQTSKRSSKLLGPKSKREKRMTSMRESSQHNMEANSEGQKIIPETLETETQRLSSSPLRKSRSNKTREGIQSVTQYVHQSGQSNSISKELTPKRLKSVSMAFDTIEDDEQINQTDNEEVTSNDDEKLNFSFNHRSGKSNVTRRKSTSTSTRSDRNVSKTIEQNIIDENGQQDQQNVTNKGSIVSTNNVSNISAKLTNKENTSKASQRKSSSNHLSTGNKSVNQNSNRVEIQEPEIQQDKKIDSARQIISSRRNICRVSVEIASNHSKRTEISSNESTGTKYLNDNSNRSLVNADTHQNSNRSENEDFQTQRSRKSKSISKDLQSHNEHNTRSRNSSLDSPRPLQTSKRSSKLLGPKSKREKRMTSMRESSQHNMEANSEGQKIIPETLETETQRLSSSPLRKSRSNKTREGIQSVTQYVHQSGQSNSISKELTPKRLKSVSMAFDTIEDDEQINQTDNEEVTSNDDEKLNFSFNHRSGKSNVTRRKSTSTSTRSDRNVSKTIEQNIIDENGQQDQQNVTNKGSIVSTNNVSNISAKLTNKENTSKASQRKSSSNHLSTGNKSVNQNSNRVEIQEPEIQQDKKIDSARQIISSRRNICRVSVEIASNHSKRTEISSNESTGTKYLNDNSNRSLVNADTHQNSNRSENEDFQTQRSRKSKSISKDLQSHNEHNTRSRNSSLDSPRPLQTSKRSSKLLGPKSKREKRMTSMRESSQHNMEANSEGQKIIPETLETETQRLSSSPLRKSRSNKTREGIQSVTQYVHQSGQSNSISKELTPKRLKSVSMAFDTIEDDEQINQTDNEEVTSNDDEKLNFSFNHRSGKSNVTRRKSTSTSTRSDRNVSKTIEQNIIDENGQQDQQNVTNKGSIVSTNNVSNISAKLTNKENTSKASQRKSSSNHLSTGNKSVNQNSNRVEIQEPEIQQDKKIDSARQIISSRRNICRVSVEIASNHSKRTEISSNESTGTKYLNDNSNRSLVNADTHQNSNRSENEDFHIQQDEQSVTERQNIVSRGHASRGSTSSQLTKNRLSSKEIVSVKSIRNISTHRNSNRTEIEESHVQQDEQSVTERQNIVSRGHASRGSTSSQLTKNRLSSKEIVSVKSTRNISTHRNSNRTEIEESHVQQDEQSVTERQSIVLRGDTSRGSASGQLTKNQLSPNEIAKEKFLMNKSLHVSSKRNQVGVTLTKSNMNEDITDHRTNLNHLQKSPLLSETPKTATDTINNDQVNNMNVPACQSTGQKDLTRKSLNKSKQRPNAGKLGSSQGKRTDLIEKNQLEKYLAKIKEQNLLKRKQVEEAVMNSLKRTSVNASQRKDMPMFRNLNTKRSIVKNKPKVNTNKAAAHLLIDGEVYKTPKLYMPKNWVTLRLYKYLEKKLEPKYKLRTRVRSEKVVRILHEVYKKITRSKKLDLTVVENLKQELARMDLVQTHFEFYNFVENYLPMEMRLKIIPNLINGVPLPKNVHAKIL